MNSWSATRQLHRDGHRVVITGRSPAKTQAIADELGTECFLADFTRLDDVRALSAGLDRACPRIDVLVNNLDHDRDFTPQLAYGTAKLENILFTRELHARYHAEGLSAAAFNPGAVATSFAAASDSFMRRIYTSRIGRAFMATPQKGASQLVWLTEATPGTDWQSGTYYEKHKPARRTNPQALAPDLARQLWDRSAELLGQKVR